MWLRGNALHAHAAVVAMVAGVVARLPLNLGMEDEKGVFGGSSVRHALTNDNSTTADGQAV